MDVFSSVNADLSHGLVAEITVHEKDRERLTAAAFEWLTEGVGVAAVRGEIERLPNELPVSRSGYLRVEESVPRVRKEGWWGYFSVSPEGTFDVLHNPYVEEALPWLKDRIAARPESASVKIGEFAEGGEIGNSSLRLSVSFDEELADYVKLTYHIDESVLVSPGRTLAEHARLLNVVNWACHRYNVVFGHFSYVHSGGATELERYLRGPARVPVLNTPAWRERLRGYSWLMVASADIVRSIGGADALSESGAFCSVSSLPNGSVLLQATPLFQEYRGESVRAVHHVLRGVLVKGDFRRPAPVPGQPPTHMVLFDA
ncbi:hypothetical protein [Streptomyces sp. NPDC006274]|uniref:hypothetical protein n=1 Tax=unclassified Streptomyces TaxID=2593676 RepID=UPI0033AB5383